MSFNERPDLEERLAEAEEATEERMHSVADLLPDSEEVHARANRLSDRAREHHRRAQRKRANDKPEDR